jgi:4-diphosphocytidyl-2-C-methyl-D-erythritol kinase
VLIDIRKRIPVAGGLAGGSGNGAAVLHALNILWGLDLSLKELMDLGAELGSDVPFCVMG